MAKQIIIVGAIANDHTGEGLRDAYIKCNANFTELYDKASATEVLTTTHTAQIASLQGGEASQAGQIAALQSGLSTAQGNITTLQTDLGTAEGNITTLQTDLGTAEGSIATIQGSMTDGTVTFRYRTVAGVLYLDKTLTATGFAGIEDIDWTNLNQTT